jgi:hypothetical protein
MSTAEEDFSTPAVSETGTSEHHTSTTSGRFDPLGSMVRISNLRSLAQSTTPPQPPAASTPSAAWCACTSLGFQLRVLASAAFFGRTNLQEARRI